MHFGPAVFGMVTHPGILDAVEQLIGPEITSNPIQHVRIKPPQRAVPASENRAHVIATDWHQDKGVTLEEADDTEFVTVWLAITDATTENGCLQVASGSYSQMLPHCSRTQVGIADAFLPESNATPAPVRSGGAVIFHPLTPHASLANGSDGYRWSFDLRYNVTRPAHGPQPLPRVHSPIAQRSRGGVARLAHLEGHVGGDPNATRPQPAHRTASLERGQPLLRVILTSGAWRNPKRHDHDIRHRGAAVRSAPDGGPYRCQAR